MPNEGSNNFPGKRPLPAPASSSKTPAHDTRPMAKTALDDMSSKGEFVRTESTFRSMIEPGGEFPPEAGRYHLHVAYACPWACGTLSMLFLKGLEGAISYSVVHPTWGRTRPDDPEDTHCGWHYRTPGDPPVPNPAGHGQLEVDDACIPDTVTHCKTIRDVYELAGGATSKYTTPALVDTKTNKVVNNESTLILRIFNSAFNEFAAHPEVDLYPAPTEAQAEALNEWIYPNINNGVYRSGFAQSQEAYEAAVYPLFESLERAEAILAKQRYLTGDSFTWIDLRLFHTLIRFDAVYVTYFKTNLKRVSDFKHLPNYVRDIYQMEPIKRSINMKHIKMHYFTSHPSLNTFAVIPAYNGIDLDAPHGRDAPQGGGYCYTQ